MIPPDKIYARITAGDLDARLTPGTMFGEPYPEYIRAGAIRTEIERRLSYYHPENVNHGLASGFREDGKAIAYEELLSFLDTLEEKPVDLEKEIKEYCGTRDICPVPDFIDAVARHFYELGRNAK